MGMNAFDYIDELYARMQRSGLTAMEVCQKAGISPTQASRWKLRRNEPRLSSLERLERALEACEAEKAAAPTSIEDLL